MCQEQEEGGLYFSSNAQSTLLMIEGVSLISGNQATQGGAVYNQFGTIYFSDGVMANNQAEIGGAIYEE